MQNIFLFEWWKETYTNFLIIRPVQKQKDFTFKGGDLCVTISTDQRYNGQTAARN